MTSEARGAGDATLSPESTAVHVRPHFPGKTSPIDVHLKSAADTRADGDDDDDDELNQLVSLRVFVLSCAEISLYF